MEKAGVMPLPPYEWQSCHFCSHMLVYPAVFAELYKGPVFAEKYACMEKTLYHTLPTNILWYTLCLWITSICFLVNVNRQRKKRRSGVRKWKCSFIKTVVKFLFMTHSPPSIMRHLRGKWLPHSQFQFYQFTAAYNKSI